MTEYERISLALQAALVGNAISQSGDQKRRATALGAEAIAWAVDALEAENETTSTD